MKVLLLAGEASGAMYARRIREELLRRHPDADVRGYADYGFSTDDLAVMGVVKRLAPVFALLDKKRGAAGTDEALVPMLERTIGQYGVSDQNARFRMN